MKRQSFILSAIILTMGGFFAKAIGALYKIPLTNILGSNGIGLYYLVFPVYSLVISICSSGVAIAVATEVAKCRKLRHRYNEQRILQVSIVLSFVLSLILTICTLCMSGLLAEAQGNINARIGYIAIAPSIIISSIIATIRGYFQGIENMVPTTVSLIIEQIVKLSVGLILAHKLAFYGVNYAVLGAILGVTFSEIVAIVVITINFIVYKGQLDFNYRNLIAKCRRKTVAISLLKNKKWLKKSSIRILHKKYLISWDRHRYGLGEALHRVIKVALPSTLSGIILPIATMIDSFLIINTLIDSGFSTITSTALYGLFGGVVQSLVSLPIIIITAISTALVPSLSGLLAYNDTNEIKYRTNFYIKITWIISILAFVLIYVFAEGIIKFLYGGGLTNTHIDEFSFAVTLLKVNSISIIYSAFLQTFTTILQVTGGACIPFGVSLFFLPLRIFLLKALLSIPSINIYGAIISSTIYLGLICMCLAFAVKRKISLEYSLYRSLFKPLFIGLICLIIGALGYTLLSSIMNYFVALIIVAILLVVMYLIWVYFGKILTPREKKYFIVKKKISVKKK